MKPKIMTTAEVAEHCRQLREKAGLSQSDLARELKVVRQHVHHAENPESIPYHKIRRQIVEYFGGSIEEVFRVS
jgi:DNA-binding XRE family transcriptional regulator